LMAADGSVMQLAAGIYPNQTKWLAYAWYIKQVQVYPQTYDWVLNSSEPEMSVGSPVSLSIYLSHDRWRYLIDDLRTRNSTAGNYGLDVPPSLKVGDQELFALESYSISDAVFVNMGNLTLNGLKINGKQVTGGWYEYGSWDTHHNPLFVVGGLDPPSYISLQEEGDGNLVWTFQQWSGATLVQPQGSPTMLLVAIPALAAVVLFIFSVVLRRRRL